MNRIFFSFIIIFVFLMSANIFAQNAQELRPGSFVNGNLSAGQEIWYRITPNEAGILIVETTGSTDTYLEAYRVVRGTEREYITENDDGGADTNAKISIITQPGTSYMFLLSGYSAAITGAFRIFASIEPMPQITALRAGTFHNGNLTSGSNHWFSVVPSEGGLLTVETSGSTDTYLEAYDENFDILDEDDDGGEGLNARIVLDVKSGKTYYFNLRGYSSSEHGPYRLMANFKPYPTPVQLNIGTFQNVNISEGQEFWYSVRATRRGRLVVETMGSTDTYMFAYSDAYDILAFDDDGGEGTNARIELTVEANRTYIFRIRGYSPSTVGAFRVFASLE